MIGYPRVHYRLTDSTSERAKALAGRGAVHGTLVTADEQSAGHGRHGRAWRAAPGTALLMSVVLREMSPLLPLAAAVAVCEASEASAPVACRVKWPNDVWVEGRKLAGVLVEGRPQAGWAVLGIGLNVTSTEFGPELSGVATSLALEPGSAEAVLGALVGALERRLSDDPAEVLRSWRERDALRGHLISWDAGEGRAAGVDDSGALLVDAADGRHALEAGEVRLVRRAGEP